MSLWLITQLFANFNKPIYISTSPLLKLLKIMTRKLDLEQSFRLFNLLKLLLKLQHLFFHHKKASKYLRYEKTFLMQNVSWFEYQCCWLKEFLWGRNCKQPRETQTIPACHLTRSFLIIGNNCHLTFLIFWTLKEPLSYFKF